MPASAAKLATVGARRARAGSARALSRTALALELHVHQIELEQQNEALRTAQRDLASEHERYVDLFDHAPVGYLTLDEDSLVTEANLTAARQLGTPRHTMLGGPFQRFVVPADGERWQRLQARAQRSGNPKRITLRLCRPDGMHFHAQLDCLRVCGPGSAGSLRVMISDVSQHKTAEKNRRIAVNGNRARLAERRRVAYGLHEDLGQRLCALKVDLVAFESPAVPPALRATADSMAAQIDAALVVVRQMSRDLHPLILDNLGLTAAMGWLLGDVAARLGLEVELQMDEAPQVDEASAVAAYHLAAALLEHTSRQVMGGVSMELLQRPHDLVLRLRCDPGRERPGGSTGRLAEVPESIRDHVHLLAARLEVDEPARGTCRISVFLPTGWSGDGPKLQPSAAS